MAPLPQAEHGIVSKIDAWHEQRQDPPRGHLGASQLGHPCARWLWLSFRWAVVEKFGGRMLRLFKRGQDEEARIVADLTAAGLVVTHTGKDQVRVELAPHIGGSLDGVIESGVPEAPRKRHVLECKTHNKKSFDELVKVGVAKAKPLHVAQIQCYMYGSGIDRALYVGACKDDDRLHVERLRLDRAEALRLIERGRRIVFAERMPEPLAADPSWYQCKFCAAHDFCHVSHLSRAVNCRTCSLVTPTPAGTWHCGRYDADGIPEDHQRAGCECHVLHPDLVPWERRPSPVWCEAIYIIDGAEVRNGEPCVKTRASAELVGGGYADGDPDDGAPF